MVEDIRNLNEGDRISVKLPNTKLVGIVESAYDHIPKQPVRWDGRTLMEVHVEDRGNTAYEELVVSQKRQDGRLKNVKVSGYFPAGMDYLREEIDYVSVHKV